MALSVAGSPSGGSSSCGSSDSELARFSYCAENTSGERKLSRDPPPTIKEEFIIARVTSTSRRVVPVPTSSPNFTLSVGSPFMVRVSAGTFVAPDDSALPISCPFVLGILVNARLRSMRRGDGVSTKTIVVPVPGHAARPRCSEVCARAAALLVAETVTAAREWWRAGIPPRSGAG
eukprot:CAMPEP_0182921860 /NCGR_PEP_ID=MMETSP0105_2-20130417/4425_1 /TAXON_ID=81532 ORGANISM="Acanthoeca-like sp., Strain 10tr" /NCGR_SAMPLE_ID=MMETSP0105_2 /ASSEMBLY_ACC=CAM_ASM_000205 /LENGTH=175 /DNA_ID=CAMNT_0025059429 /DNA_START=331 /DNA_END=854 /DNA_ORIENTATION=-